MQRKHAFAILIVYILICLFALLLGMRKVRSEKAAAGGTAAAVQQTVSAVPEETAAEEETDGSFQVDWAFILVAAGSVLFGIWLGERRKKGKEPFGGIPGKTGDYLKIRRKK